MEKHTTPHAFAAAGQGARRFLRTQGPKQAMARPGPALVCPP